MAVFICKAAALKQNGHQNSHLTLDSCGIHVQKQEESPWRPHHLPGMKVKPLGSCITPAEAAEVLSTVPLALVMLLTLELADTGAR